MLEVVQKSHKTCSIEAVQVIVELIDLAGHMREANELGEALDLTEDKIAFYDALET